MIVPVEVSHLFREFSLPRVTMDSINCFVDFLQYTFLASLFCGSVWSQMTEDLLAFYLFFLYTFFIIYSDGFLSNIRTLCNI